MSAYDTKNL